MSTITHVAFGLPSVYHSISLPPHHFQPLVPIQVLDSLLLPAIRQLTTISATPTVSPLQLAPPAPRTDSVYLPSIDKVLPGGWKHISEQSQLSAKADDAEVNEYLWNGRVSTLYPTFTPSVLDKLRARVVRRQKYHLFLELCAFLRSRHSNTYAFFRMFGRRGLVSSRQGRSSDSILSTWVPSAPQWDKLLLDIDTGAQVLRSFSASSFFEWSAGSTLIFWRWHPDSIASARDGFPAQIYSPLPRHLRPASRPKQEVYDKVYSKFKRFLERFHLTPCHPSAVKSFIDYFGVKKGDTDIRVVYNGTSCGLNGCIFASNFWLPNAPSMSRILGYNYSSVDIDLGEMFHNFPMLRFLHQYAGVDLTPFLLDLMRDFPDLKKFVASKRLTAQFNRDFMGFRPSPEWSCRFYYLAEEFARGNELEDSNPLYWDKVVINVLGNSDFNPAFPNLMKLDSRNNRIAGDIRAYVDDLRTVGYNLEQAWAIARRIASHLQYLGIQDAPRKRRKDNGPWAGTMFNATADEIQKTVAQPKWDKGRGYIQELNQAIQEKGEALVEFNFKRSEVMRGYFCHLAMTFDILFPYLKGFHLTLCNHLPKRDENGWKMRDPQWATYCQDHDIPLEDVASDIPNPVKVKPVPRFFECLKALPLFFEQPNPPIVIDRSKNVRMLIYGYADAAKIGSGASLKSSPVLPHITPLKTNSEGIKYRIGTWGKDADDTSSNFKEFENLVTTLDDEESSGSLDHSIVIMATDNSTVESALYKGNSSSEKLFDLIIHFRTLELRTGSRFIVTYVPGERMKAQGTDGLSRGHMREGVSLGECMEQFCPWGKTALEREPKLSE